MARIDVHVVTLHCVLNLIDDGLPGGLDSEYLCNLDNMVGGRLLSNDA